MDMFLCQGSVAYVKKLNRCQKEVIIEQDVTYGLDSSFCVFFFLMSNLEALFEDW